MTSKDIIKQAVEFAHMLSSEYVKDLTDDQLLVRSVEGTNHIAWQLGHLITSDCQMLSALGHATPPLPEGFVESYTKEASTSDDPKKFHTLKQYLDFKEASKQATLAAIDATPDEDLDKPGPEPMREYAPTIAAALMMPAQHWLMHAGQYIPIRRKVGKPPLF